MAPPKKPPKKPFVPRAIRNAEEVVRRSVKLRSGRGAVLAGRALGALGKPAMPRLIEATKDESPFVRSGALFGFEAAAGVGVDGVEVVDALLAVLSTEADPRVIETACGVLGRLGPAAATRAEAALRRVAAGTDERSATTAKEALATIG